MKEIELTKGKVALVDDEDYEWLSQWKWHYHTTRRLTDEGYAARHDYSSGKCERIWMHRLIVNCPDEMQVDHLDGNRLNNQRSNLRVCTAIENSRNRRKQRTPTSSQYKGIRKVNDETFRCIIKNKHIGTFSNEIACANAYNYYAVQFFGEFAKLNPVEYMTEEEWKSYQKVVDKTSPYEGVSWSEEHDKWECRLIIRKRSYFLGYYDTDIEAAIVRNNKIMELGLSIDRLNNIPDGVQFVPTKQKTTSSKYIGVHFSQKWNKWKAEIIVSAQNRLHVGTFDSEQDAYFARRNKMIELGFLEKLEKEEEKYRVLFGGGFE